MDGGLKHAGFYAEHAKGKVLDIGFGLGYIAYACVKKAIKNKERIEITGLELDKGILGKIKGIDLDCEYEFIKEAVERLNFENSKVRIKIIPGDARKTVKSLNGKFNAVFLDGFSVMKNPELYSYDFLLMLKARLAGGGVVVSYTNNPVFRAGLREAGFNIGSVGGGTIAGVNKNFKLNDAEEKLIRAFGRSFRDPYLNWSRKRIIKEWKKLPLNPF